MRGPLSRGVAESITVIGGGRCKHGIVATLIRRVREGVHELAATFSCSACSKEFAWLVRGVPLSSMM